jgi:hypothetical protein
MSSVHAEIYKVGPIYYIDDIQATNGYLIKYLERGKDYQNPIETVNQKF